MYSDQFNDTRTYVTKGAAGVAGGAPPRKKHDSAAKRFNEIADDTEHLGDVKRVDVDIGNKMRTLRAAKEWSQKDLALHAGVKIDVVRDYENGKAIPDNKILSKFENALGGQLRERPPKKR